MEPQNHHSEKDDCPYCQNLNLAIDEPVEIKKAEEKKKKGLSGIMKACLIIAVLGVVGIIISTGAFKTERPALLDQLDNTIQGVQAGGLKINQPAPGFTVQDISGKTVSLSDFQEKKPVLLVFWATWCGYCEKELPDLEAFTQTHQDEIQVITVFSGEPKETVADYVKEKDVNFLVLLDETKEIWNSYLVRGTPGHFLIDKQGIIITLHPGQASFDNLETMLTMVPN